MRKGPHLKQGLVGLGPDKVYQLSRTLQDHPNQVLNNVRDGSTNQRFSFNQHYSRVKNKRIDTHTVQMALKMPKNYS